MKQALVDSNVVYAFRSKRDQYHDRATRIVKAIDSNELPQGYVTNYTLPEILNPIQKRAGDAGATETLNFLVESAGFRVRHLTKDDFTRGEAIFRRTNGVEITDAFLVAYMQRAGIEYVYSFDDDFDRFDGISRLVTADDPYD